MLHNHSAWDNLHNNHYRHFGLLCGIHQNILVWMKVCQSTDWFESWVVLVEALCTGSLDLGKLDSGCRICHTTALLCSCMKHLDNKPVLLDPRVEAGTEDQDTALCHLGILHNCHNRHHTSAPVRVEVHNCGCCLQQKVVEVVLLELVGRCLQVPVLDVLEGRQRQERDGQHLLQEAPVVELNTGLGEAVLHLQAQEEHLLEPVLQPEDLNL